MELGAEAGFLRGERDAFKHTLLHLSHHQLDQHAERRCAHVQTGSIGEILLKVIKRTWKQETEETVYFVEILLESWFLFLLYVTKKKNHVWLIIINKAEETRLIRFGCFKVDQPFTSGASDQLRCVCVPVVRTRSSLKGVYGSVDAGGNAAVLPRSDLRVQSSDVEQHAALLEGQRALRRRDARQRVVPETWVKCEQHIFLFSHTWTTSNALFIKVLFIVLAVWFVSYYVLLTIKSVQL